MRHNESSNGIGPPIALILAVASLTACGSESTAASNGAQGNTATHAATTAVAAAPSAALPAAALTAWETFARGQCRDQGERFAAVRFTPLTRRDEAVDPVEQHFAGNTGGFVPADFNADGTPDFVVTTPGYGCISSGPAYGDQGPPVDFIVSTTSGYRVFDGFMGRVAPAMIARRDDRDVLDLPGGFTGRCGPVTTVTWGWTGNGIDAVERRNDSGQLVDREGCAQTPIASQANSATAALPVEKGFYANGGAGNGSCAAAIAQQFFAYWDGTHIEALGGNRYRIRFREVEAAEAILNDRIFTVNSRTSLTEQDGARWTHCPTAQIPPSVLQSVRRELGLQ